MSLSPIVLEDEGIVEYFTTHKDINVVEFIRNEIEKQTNPEVQSSNDMISIPLSQLKKVYLEWYNVSKLRDKCVSDLKAIKMDTLLSICQQHLNIPDTYFDCVFCQFKARSKKALALHLRKCAQTVSESEVEINDTNG